MRRQFAHAVIVFLFACGGYRVEQQLDPIEAALIHSSAGVLDAIDAGLGAEAAQEWIGFSARFNPANCACPPWEIILRGHWVRVWLEAEAGSGGQLDRLETTARRDLGEGVLTQYRLFGRLEVRNSVAPTGVDYVTLVVVDPAMLDASEDR